MQVVHGLEQFEPPPGGITLTIGNFDGLHRGHQRIIQKARAVAAELSAPVFVLTFHPHPLTVLAPQRAPAPLTTLTEKLHLLAAAGADGCIIVRSEPAFLSQSAQEFLASLVQRCRPRALVEGPDFNFGRGRAGSIETLKQAGTQLGFAVHIIPTARCDELPGAPSVHSSAIRAALKEGRLDVARHMLGRPYRLVGTVQTGSRRGTLLSFPTANLEDIPHMLPQAGVYAAIAQLPDGSLHLAAVNLGPQPTFGSGLLRVEAHLLDWSGTLLGSRVGLHLLARLRGQQKFENTAQLIEQIRRDVAAVREYVHELKRLGESALIPL
jgi:riboflavin kinase/FMN adenylyltransferase